MFCNLCRGPLCGRHVVTLRVLVDRDEDPPAELGAGVEEAVVCGHCFAELEQGGARGREHDGSWNSLLYRLDEACERPCQR